MSDPVVNEKRLKIKEGPFRSYDVSAKEVLHGTKAIIEAAGYTVLPNDYIGFAKPSFRIRREWPGRSNEIIAVVRPGIRKALDGLVYLESMRSTLGDSYEYALVLPPINEWQLLEFLDAEVGRLGKEMRARQFMLWMYNPAEDAIMFFVGSSSDPVFRGSILLPGFISMRMLRQRAAAEAKRGK